MTVIGVDWGQVRVGVAVSDESGRLARPLETVPAPSRAAGVSGVVEAARRWSAARIVVGLPLNMDGSEGESAAKARAFAAALREASGLEVILWDERLSSRAGEALLRAGGGKAGRDAAAACVILQAYLDAGTGTGRP